MPAKLTAQDIYYKEFSVDKRSGYSSDEVDSFLDQVIEDYQEYEEQTQKLSSALVSCDHKIKEISEENASLKAQTTSLNEQISVLRNALQEAKVKLERATVEIRTLKEAQEPPVVATTVQTSDDKTEEFSAQGLFKAPELEETEEVVEEKVETDPLAELIKRVERLEKAVFESSHS